MAIPGDKGAKNPMFNEFRLAWYRFTLVAGEKGLILPPLKGALFLKPTFMELLRRFCCIHGRKECTPSCLLAEDCAYAHLYRANTNSFKKKSRMFIPLSPPLAWQMPLEKKTDYVPGEQLYFHLTLVGRAISFLPRLVEALAALGRDGLTGEGSYLLKSVHALAPLGGFEQLVFQAGDGKVAQTEVVLSGAQVQAWAASQLLSKYFKILFLTPTCLLEGDECLEVPHFPVILKALFRRVSSLYYYFHGRKEADVDYRELMKKGERVGLARDYTRFSVNRQRKDASLELAGLLGEVTFTELPPEILPLLKLGEFLNLGQYAAYGLGRYRLKL